MSELDRPGVRRALNAHLANALGMFATALQYQYERHDLALLSIENAVRSLHAFRDVMAAALGDECPKSYQLSPEKRREILGPPE